MASGGARVPAEPAAVSGPGRFSTRTDSGTAQLAAPGGSYGSRQQMETQQQSAPVPVGQGNAAPAASGGGPGVPGSDMGAFGPTQRPNESPLAGVTAAPQQEPPDSKLVLQMIYDKYPSPWIASLLND